VLWLLGRHWHSVKRVTDPGVVSEKEQSEEAKVLFVDNCMYKYACKGCMWVFSSSVVCMSRLLRDSVSINLKFN
jgi:hypothetical protein